MAAEYSKKTVAELTEILKTRGLPSSGKKAELVARLHEDDKKAESQPEEAASAPTPEVAPQPTTGTADAVATSESKPTNDSATTTDPVIETADAQPTVPAKDYSLHLPTSSLDSELAKRKARAERFGTANSAATTENTGDAAVESTPQADSNAESLRALERAKRFGTGGTDSAPTAISKLDEALPTEGPRQRGSKRKAEAEPSVLDDPGLKKSFASRGRGGSRGGRFAHRQRGGAGGEKRNGGGRGPEGVKKSGGGGGGTPAFVSEKDKAAAEARKKKFATA